MKIQFTFLTLTVSAIPFAFWEVEAYACKIPQKLYRETADKPKYYVEKIDFKNQQKYDYNKFQANNIDKYFALTNKQVNCSLYWYMFNNDPYVSLDAKNKIYDEPIVPYLKKKYIFFFVEEVQNINIHMLNEINEYPNYFFRDEQFTPINNKLMQNSQKHKMQSFQLHPTFTTSSGVTIDNILEGDIKINIDGKQLIDFQKILINYFDSHQKYVNFAEKLKNLPTSKTFEILKNVPDINQLAFQRLQNCTILEVYTIRQNDKGQNTIIWGSAQENKEVDGEKRKFYWITELEQDIADVVQEYYTKYVKSS